MNVSYVVYSHSGHILRVGRCPRAAIQSQHSGPVAGVIEAVANPATDCVFNNTVMNQDDARAAGWTG